MWHCLALTPATGDQGKSPLPDYGERARVKGQPPPRLADQLPLPPHLPVATLKLPHSIGLRQSEIRSFESAR